MILFKGTSSLSPLEILHGIGPAGRRLQAEQLMDAGTLHLVEGMPVHQAGSAFHEHKGLFLFHGTHDGVMEGVFRHGFE